MRVGGMTESGSNQVERLDEAIACFFRQLDAGDEPDRARLLTNFPDLADDLKAFFRDHDRLVSVIHEPHNGRAAVSPILAPQNDPPSHELRSDFRNEKIVEPSEAGDVPCRSEYIDALSESETTVAGESPADAADISLLLQARKLSPGLTPILRLPADFGGYELLELIAYGGMGVVYKARQRSMDRIVAVKMILAGRLAAEKDVQRFIREARAAGSLDHSAIVPIYEVGAHAGHNFFSMGYIDGCSLADTVREGPVEERTAARYVLTIAEAVNYAHERGIVHRDIKPGNVLMDRSGRVLIADFGLAIRHDDEDGVTLTGQILGTPAWMAPEQAGGRSEEVGPLSDVYSLGAVLYGLITGRPPFAAATPAEVLRQVENEEPVWPRRLNSAVSTDLQTICLKCLRKEPSARYRSAGELPRRSRVASHSVHHRDMFGGVCVR
ncbi:MAG: serine/threonine protein kinase [Planctomycetaceae bacterium]|nr:serine/threonine protein kinase [Planctomycetaceae bacterium]